MWPDWLTSLLEILAVALIVGGVAVIFWPAALIVAGAAVLALSILHADDGAQPEAAPQ